jgi:hypothetical protein
MLMSLEVVYFIILKDNGALVWNNISRDMPKASTKWRRSTLVWREIQIVEKKMALIWPDHKQETKKRET